MICDSTSSDWIRPFHNVDGTVPDANFLGGLVFDSIRNYKDELYDEPSSGLKAIIEVYDDE